MGEGERCLVIDAMVLIDFSAVDRSVLRLTAEHLGRVLVLTPVLVEVTGLSARACTSLGLKVMDPTDAELEEASRRQPGLSFEDRLCLSATIRRGCVCITNDRKLRKTIEEAGGTCMWSLQLLLELVRVGGLATRSALRTAREIQQRNPGYIGDDVLHRFEAKLNEID